MSRHPEILWAQRSDKVFITVSLPDAKNPHVKLEPDGRFTFSATEGSSDQEYSVDLELFGKLNVEGSKIAAGLRHTVCELQKAEKGWWKRLLKAEGKAPPYVKADWDKWVDEDEEDDAAKRMSSFDMGGLGGMGGMGGMEGMGGMGGLAGMGGMGGMGGMEGMGGMGGLAGMGGMGGMDGLGSMGGGFEGMPGMEGMMDFAGMNAGGEAESDDDDEFSESKTAEV